MMLNASLPHFTPILGEIVLFVSILAQLLIGVWQRHVRLMTFLSLGVILLTVMALSLGTFKESLTFYGLYRMDYFSQTIKLFLCALSSVVLLYTMNAQDTKEQKYFEVPILILSALLGMMLMVSCDDFVGLFLSVELQSLSFYVLIARYGSVKIASEAGMKYFILGALSTGILLLGISLIYGFTGTTGFESLKTLFKVSKTPDMMPILFGLVFVITAMGFKLTLAPFHMWAPDVYQGSATPMTLFLATAPKVSAFVLLMKILYSPMSYLSEYWTPILICLSVLSMFFGAIAALTQKNIKRLMAYSAVGHMGFALIGLITGQETGLRSSLLYVVLYALMIATFFMFLIHFQKQRIHLEKLSDLSGLGRASPSMAFVFGFVVFAMSGVPPFPGFLTKLFILQASISHGYYALSILAVLYSVIACAYHLILLKAIFFDQPTTEILPEIRTNLYSTIFLFSLCLLMLYFTIRPNGMITWASRAVTGLLFN